MTVSSVNLSKKNVIITGALSGIGRACAVIISRLGARVALVARNLDRLRETMNMIRGEGHRFDSCDIRDPDQIRDVTKSITSDFGRIDGAVLAAGILITRPFKWQKNINQIFCFYTHHSITPLHYFPLW